jgi:VIT1/CCC1 family predicted Fe2+/Mn2+ transporter
MPGDPCRAPSVPPAPQRISRRAIWSLVLSILWLGGLGSAAGIMLGISARRRIAGTGEPGAGLAAAGIVAGVITC